MKELLSKIIFKQKYPVKIKSSLKVETALSQFPCFRNLSYYNWKWESAHKTTIYRERKSNAFLKWQGLFSNAAWFAISITWAKQNFPYIL